MTFETLSVPTTIRYQVILPSQEITSVWYVLHGYGQLVSFFSRKFEALNLKNTLLVFPEGRHRFYLQGSSGRVGASWMTKEWREEDIRWNNETLNQLHKHILLQHPSIRKTSVLGFSQGGATASRWVVKNTISFDHFVSWASVFPPDLENKETQLNARVKSFVLGSNDEYFSEQSNLETRLFYEKMGFIIRPFEGKHDIDFSLLKSLIDEI